MDGATDSNLPLEQLEDDDEEISLEDDTENALGKGVCLFLDHIGFETKYYNWSQRQCRYMCRYFFLVYSVWWIRISSDLEVHE